MLSKLKSLFSAGPDQNKAQSRQGRIEVAATVILLEAAHADSEFTEEEDAHVIETVRSLFGIEDGYAREIVELAQQERKHAVELYSFADTINRNFSPEEKMLVMEAIWRIFYADGKLDKHENHLAHKLTTILRLSHKDMIAAKLKAK